LTLKPAGNLKIAIQTHHANCGSVRRHQ
jgi:hypothetical protein